MKKKNNKTKYIEASEIDNEVKRLLRIDNNVMNVKWEVICENKI
jgi:macrodomain Ter protein organizer (MatP/YcbG family)